MPVLGITGGIAAGKSTVTRIVAQHLRAQVFDTDACARLLPEEDEGVRGALRQTFGDEIFDPEQKLDRGRLREKVFGNESARRALESILHPIIRDRWMAQAGAFRGSGSWLIVDIPLLFETRAETAFDVTLAVLCSVSTQRRRLTEIRRLEPDIANKMIASQWPADRKLPLADHILWNDGSLRALEMQAAHCAATLIPPK